MAKLIVGIDVGGTKVAGGLVTMKGRLEKALVVPTRAEKGFRTSFGQIVHLIERLIKLAGGKHNIVGVGVCAPGPLNPKAGVVINPPNLPGWRNIRLTHLLENHFHLPPNWKTMPTPRALQKSSLERRWDIDTFSM